MSKTRFGVAVLAAFAVLAIGASAAQAAVFTAAEYPAFVVAEPASPGSPMFEFESGQTVACEFGGFAGEMTEATGELELGLGLGACVAFGGEGSVEASGCGFVLDPEAGAGDEFTGSFDIACPPGESIVITGEGCEVKIGDQAGLGSVSYDAVTAAEPDEVEAGFAMEPKSGFTYTTTQAGGACPLGLGVKTDGVVLGGLKVRAGNTETLEPIDFGIE